VWREQAGCTSDSHSSKDGKAAQQEQAALDKVLMTQDSALVQMLLELLLPYADVGDNLGPAALQIRAAGTPAPAVRQPRAGMPACAREGEACSAAACCCLLLPGSLVISASLWGYGAGCLRCQSRDG
jgi:hypothetical protein